MTYESLEDLKIGNSAELPGNVEFYGMFEGGKRELDELMCWSKVGMIKGAFDLRGVGTSLNEMFPSVKPVGIEEYLRHYY